MIVGPCFRPFIVIGGPTSFRTTISLYKLNVQAHYDLSMFTAFLESDENIYRKYITASWRRINLYYTIKKLLHNTCTGHKSLALVIIKRNQTTYYIHWASKVATNANKHAS